MNRIIRSICLLFVCTAAACATTSESDNMSTAQPVSMSTNANALHQNMRELWADHVVWTRGYIIAATTDDPSASSALDRLMKNQEEIGNAIAPYYGAEAAGQLTTLLKDHIKIAGELVAASKANDTAKAQDADRRWHENAASIATFLSNANPNWSRETLQNMLNEHLALTTREATLRLQKNWTEDASNFDRIFDQSMMMADALSDGVIRQFAARF